MNVIHGIKFAKTVKCGVYYLLKSRANVKTNKSYSFCEHVIQRNVNQGTQNLKKPRIMASGITTSAFKQTDSAQSTTLKNRLANEKSSYLLQHASNPVDWFPWGEEAFQKARKENKVIFLSVGYSTCHWCHVMERESFENEEIAKIMNENFVSIKVDREERPDVDKVYMTFVQATSGSGGWPMSVWLTPDLKPILGGTYFPPDDRYHGHAGFATVLKRVSQEWKKNHDKICEQGGRIIEIIMKNLSVGLGDNISIPNKDCIKRCFKQLAERYDKVRGGFSMAPKFPQAVNFNFLFRMYALNPTSDESQLALNMALHTLTQMDKGGIHDHISQGFHRYSTDEEWHVPHFEKMLYDQAQLAVSYLEAFQITKDEHFSNVAHDILSYVSRDLSNQHGGFYCAEDADSLPSFDKSHKKEGAFCVWTYEEIMQHLSMPLDEKPDIKLADIFIKYYNVLPKGNVDPYKDPHDELKGKNILIIKLDEKAVAENFKISEAAVKKAIDKSKSILYEVRQQRPKPHLDDKFLAAWNGMMISAFAKAGQIFGQQHYSERAMQAVRFLHNFLYDDDSGCLRRSAYRDKDDNIAQIANPVSGVLEDYAFIIRALLDLYEANYNSWCIKWAEELQEKQNSLFWDADKGAYFYSNAADASIVFRLKEDQDGAEPNSNSISVSNLLRLYNYTNNAHFHEKALKILEVYGSRLEQIPIALPEMVCGLMLFYSPSTRIVVVGEKEDSDTQKLLRCIHSHFLPFKTVILHDSDSSSYIKSEVVKNLAKQNGLSTAYVCKDKSCSLPVTTVPELENLIKA